MWITGLRPSGQDTSHRSRPIRNNSDESGSSQVYQTVEVDMAFRNLKLMDMTGPKDFAAHIALAEVLQQGPQAGQRIQVAKFRMTLNDELQRNLIEFDDQTFVPFQNPLQIRLVVVNADGGQDLGETIIDASDANKPGDELFIKFFVNGIVGGPFYELGYRVIPG